MNKKKSLLIDILEVILSVAVISFILLKFVVLPCEVHGRSMYPTLQEGERTYSFVITRNLGIKRFDICVVEVNPDEDNEKLLVKRVIGMPNETVEYKDNVLYINGEKMDEDFLQMEVHTQDLKVTLGDDEYYCLGDNRDISKDSRYYGPFKGSDIKATKMFVLYPFDKFGIK